MDRLEELTLKIEELIEDYPEFRIHACLIESNGLLHSAYSTRLCQLCLIENLFQMAKERKLKHLTAYEIN